MKNMASGSYGNNAGGELAKDMEALTTFRPIDDMIGGSRGVVRSWWTRNSVRCLSRNQVVDRSSSDSLG